MLGNQLKREGQLATVIGVFAIRRLGLALDLLLLRALFCMHLYIRIIVVADIRELLEPHVILFEEFVW